jgi:hypothetical protein
MIVPLINFLIPLLFFISIGFLLYAIVILILSFVKKAPQLRYKSLKISALPVLYIVGTLSLVKFLAWNYNRKMIPQVAGTYLYSFNDSTRVNYVLNTDNTFIFQSPNRTVNGTWAIATNTHQITFFDQDKHEFTHSVLQISSTEKALVFLNNKDTIRLVKQD